MHYIWHLFIVLYVRLCVTSGNFASAKNANHNPSILRYAWTSSLSQWFPWFPCQIVLHLKTSEICRLDTFGKPGRNWIWIFKKPTLECLNVMGANQLFIGLFFIFFCARLTWYCFGKLWYWIRQYSDMWNLHYLARKRSRKETGWNIECGTFPRRFTTISS